jgi:hypothetical protein
MATSAKLPLRRLLRSSCHTSETLNRSNNDAPFTPIARDHAWQCEFAAQAHWKRPAQLPGLSGGCGAVLAGKDSYRVPLTTADLV